MYRPLINCISYPRSQLGVGGGAHPLPEVPTFGEGYSPLPLPEVPCPRGGYPLPRDTHPRHTDPHLFTYPTPPRHIHHQTYPPRKGAGTRYTYPSWKGRGTRDTHSQPCGHTPVKTCEKLNINSRCTKYYWKGATMQSSEYQYKFSAQNGRLCKVTLTMEVSDDTWISWKTREILILSSPSSFFSK